jgi:hypothetical protein
MPAKNKHSSLLDLSLGYEENRVLWIQLYLFHLEFLYKK